MDCVFCKIINKELPGAVVFEDDNMIAIKSIQPVSEIHILLIPKKHIVSFLEMDDDTIKNLKNVAQSLVNSLNLGDGYKLVINGGKYQFVKHFHWHLLSGELENKSDILNRT